MVVLYPRKTVCTNKFRFPQDKTATKVITQFNLFIKRYTYHVSKWNIIKSCTCYAQKFVHFEHGFVTYIEILLLLIKIVLKIQISKISFALTRYCQIHQLKYIFLCEYLPFVVKAGTTNKFHIIIFFDSTNFKYPSVTFFAVIEQGYIFKIRSCSSSCFIKKKYGNSSLLIRRIGMGNIITASKTSNKNNIMKRVSLLEVNNKTIDQPAAATNERIQSVTALSIEKDSERDYSEEEINLILENWIHASAIQKGWISEFNKIITKYIKYYKLLKSINIHHGFVKRVKFSSDGTKIVSAAFDGTIQIWDIKLQKTIKVLKRHSSWVYCAQFSPDGTMIVSGSDDKTVRIWDVRLEEEVHILNGHSSGVTSVQFSPDGQTIASCSFDKAILLWDVKSGEELKKLIGHLDWVNDVQFSPDGQFIVSSSFDNTIAIWSVKQGKRINQLRGHTGVVMRARYSPDGFSILSCSADKTIRIWDSKSGRELKRIEGHSRTVSDVTCSQSGQIIVTCSYDGTVRLWDLKSGQEFQKLEIHSNWVTTVDISPDDKIIVSGSHDKTIVFCGM
ncbi:WD-40 repeat protein [Reticulomyxa filosa]|uniref:WD-40 repeat protein n=1 Tax=Reticulomyxa filosa TaxID=46433 RepID=X6MQC6_RETFI|nr:WD-40 repeat protein [Reticulomyxa filosa]|eukprot:ETO16208.1 WD-40 repeat protein [Reticulomyxa filosa]